MVIWSFLAGNLKIVPFRTASGKIPKASAGLGLEQRFFLNESLINKLYEYEAIFEQLFSEKKLFYFKAYFYRTGGLFGKRNTYLESAFYKLQNGTHFNNF